MSCHVCAVTSCVINELPSSWHLASRGEGGRQGGYSDKYHPVLGFFSGLSLAAAEDKTEDLVNLFCGPV